MHSCSGPSKAFLIWSVNLICDRTRVARTRELSYRLLPSNALIMYVALVTYLSITSIDLQIPWVSINKYN